MEFSSVRDAESEPRVKVLSRDEAREHLPDRETRTDWFYVGGIIGGTVALLLLMIAFMIWVVYKLWLIMSGGLG
jgi:hypothetical protein